VKISVYGPSSDLDMVALGELIKHIPPESVEVLIKCPVRKSVRERVCQLPNHLFYDASCDNTTFVHLVQSSPTAEFVVTVTR